MILHDRAASLWTKTANEIQEAQPSRHVILSAAFIARFAMEQIAVYWDLSLQQNVAKAMLARVYSYDAVGSFAAVPLGEATAGGLAELVGVRTARLGCAAVSAVATVRALTQREVREVRDTAPSKVSEV